MAVQARVVSGWNVRRIAQSLGVEPETVQLWFRDPFVIRASAEITRAYISMEILPLALNRLRAELSNPFANLGQLTRACAYLSDLAGLAPANNSEVATPAGRSRHGAPILSGAGARPIAELTANELRELAEQGREALTVLQATDSASDAPHPLDD